ESLGDGSHVRISDTGFRIDRDGVDLFRRVVRHSFDVHAAFSRDDKSDTANRTINQQRAIEFAGDVSAIFDVETVDLLASVTGLRRHQRVAEHFLGEGDNVFDGLGQTNATLGVRTQFLELALAATAGMDLRLDDIE